MLASLGAVWSTYVKMDFVSSLAWDEFGQAMLRCILCPSWHGKFLVNTSLYAFYVLLGMVRVWSTHILIYLFICVLSVIQQMLCARVIGSGLVNAC